MNPIWRADFFRWVGSTTKLVCYHWKHLFFSTPHFFFSSKTFKDAERFGRSISSPMGSWLAAEVVFEQRKKGPFNGCLGYVYTCTYTWNLFVLYFGCWPLQNKVFSSQNEGHLGSRYIILYYRGWKTTHLYGGGWFRWFSGFHGHSNLRLQSWKKVNPYNVGWS